MRVSLEKMMRGYLGFLVGTGKSALTVSSYRGDLLVFQEFLRERKLEFTALKAKDFDDYQFFLRKRGLRANTRRRKLITARALYRYAVTRKKIASSPARFIKPPARVERLPWIPVSADLQRFLEGIDLKSPLGLRNQLIVRLLAETGLSLSELCFLQWEQLRGLQLQVTGKKSRSVGIGKALAHDLARWKKQLEGHRFLFPGYNRFGLTSPRMTPRGVEILFRELGKRTGLPGMKPKSLRHYAVMAWLPVLTDKEIQAKLGVTNTYSLQPYRKYAAELAVTK